MILGREVLDKMFSGEEVQTFGWREVQTLYGGEVQMLGGRKFRRNEVSKHSGKGINTSTLSTSLSVCLDSACCSPGKLSSVLSSLYANGVQKYAIIVSIHDSEEWERLPALFSQLDLAASQASPQPANWH